MMVGGEAGDEAIAPIDKLLDYVRTAVNESNEGMREAIERIIAILDRYLPQRMDVILDSGALVGELTPQIDEELGKRKVWKK